VAGANGTKQARQEQRKRPVTAAQARRNEEIRMRLLRAAGKVIGKYGYAGCSIARVTSLARVAHGTFYLHFSSQQDLFDSVLPTLGASMLHIIGQAIHNPKDIMDLEQRAFMTNLNYLVENPYMFRVLTEAELYAPAAFEKHMDAMIAGYTRSLKRSRSLQHIANFSDEELETIASMLIGARTYLVMRYGLEKQAVKSLPAEKIEVYLKFVAHGLTNHFFKT